MSALICLSINRWIHLSVRPYINSLIYFCSFPFIPFVPPLLISPPLVGFSGRGPPLICFQNKQPGKHHETFRGGRAAFSLIHTGIPEMHSSSCSQSSPITEGFNLKVCMHVLRMPSLLEENLDLCRKKKRSTVCVCAVFIKQKNILFNSASIKKWAELVAV